METSFTDKMNSSNNQIPESEAAELLGISINDLHKLSAIGININSREAILKIKSKPSRSITDEASQVGVKLQGESYSFFRKIRKLVIIIAILLILYLLLVLLFILGFLFNPAGTSSWLGYATEGQNSTNNPTQLYQDLLQPISRVSLGIVKSLNPSAYEQVEKVTILDPNQVLLINNSAGEPTNNTPDSVTGSVSDSQNDNSNTLSPILPIKFRSSSYLLIPDSGLISNLNAEFLQGKKPGTNVGDIAVVGSSGALTKIDQSSISGITNSQLTNSGLTINTTGPITGGGFVSLGDSLTLDCPSCSALNASGVAAGTYGGSASISTFTVDAYGRLTSASNSAITGLTDANLSGSAGISNSNLANSSVTLSNGLGINVTGGTLSLGGIATINLANTLVTPGSYGSASTIPTYTVDSSGRLTAASNAAIAGLTTTNLSATANITNSQLANSSLTLATSGPLGGGGAVALGGSLNLTCATCVVTGGNLFTAAAGSGSNSSIVQGGTLILAQGTGVSTVNNGSGTITINIANTAVVAGSYGSGLTIPTYTVDSTGRLTAASNTAIAGLTTTNFASANISQWTNNSGYITASSSDVLTNKTFDAGLNILSNVTATNLTAGNFSSKINSGTYSIDISGNSATATLANAFSGSLSGDVTGTQSSTTVAKINGNPLGSTSPTSGNILIANGVSWITRTVSGDASIDSTGVLTLNYAAGQSASSTLKGFLTAADWTTFNNKQNDLGFTPENVANKSTDTNLGLSNTLYPTQNAVKSYVDNKEFGLVWHNALESVNLIADTNTPVGSPVNGDAYIINTGGNTGAWSGFSAGDLVQYQSPTWVLLKSLVVGDRFGVSFKSATTASGAMTGSDDSLVEVTGGSSGAFTYTFESPNNNDAVFVDNTNAVEESVSYTYSTHVNEWVQLSATSSLNFANGLNTSGNTISLGDLTADWTQAGVFDINTAGDISINGGDLKTTALTASVFNATATTLNIGGSATAINIGASGSVITGGGSLTLKSGTASDLTIDSGTTGNLNVGTSANAKIITVGNVTTTTALNLKSGSGNVNFTVGDSGSSGKVQIGNSGTATADLLVLDNGTADPAGVDGGMYYNTTSGRFKCYENSSWINCSTKSGDSLFTVAASSGSNSSITRAATLTLAQGTGISTVNNGSGTVTIGLTNTAVAAGSYGSATSIPTYTVDAQGRLTAAANVAIAGLTTANFTSANISQWINNSGYITASTIDILTNKTIAAGSNTITGLTNANLSGSAGITNANLANSNVTLSNGTGISITGGALSLGGAATINLANTTVSAASYGSATSIPTYSVDAQGRLTAAANVAIAGLTTSNLSASAGITNAQLANSSVTINTSGPLGGGGSIALGGAGLTLTCATCLFSGGSIFTAAASSGSNSTILQGGTIVLAQGTNITTTNNGLGTITFATVSNPTFATGLTVTTGAINLTSTSGALAFSGLSASTISTGANNLTFTSGNINTTATGINSTAIGATTASTGAFTTLAAASEVITSTGTLTNALLINQTTGGTLTSALNITRTAGTVTNGIQFNGTIGTDITTAAARNLTIDSGTTGSIIIGGDSSAETINVGTGAAAKTMVLGSTDTTSITTIQSGSGNINFQVSGTGTTGTVQVGAGGSGSATPDLLNLDVKNTASDPAGTNGAMYYNSSMNKFRCFQNGAWTDCIGGSGVNLQHAAAYDNNESLTNIPSATQVVLGTVSVTPASATADVYVTGFAEVRSSNATDQPFTLTIETTNNCTGTTVGNATNTYTITSAVSTTIHLGNVTVSGIASDPGTSAQPYSLCASVSAGDTDVLDWKLEALVVGTNASSGSNPSADSVNDTSITSPTPGTNPAFGTEIEILTPTNPTITPDSNTQRVLISGAVQFTNPAGGEDTNDAALLIRIRRGSGSCAGTQVGTDFTASMSDPLQVIWIPFSVIDSPATTSAQTYTVCAAQRDTNGATATNATVTEVMMTLQEIAATGADLAEIYFTNDALEPGNVVMIDSNLSFGVKKTDGLNAKGILGIVSTQPGMVLDDGSQTTGVRAIPIALAGRVPVKVSTENGAIKPGDYLTTSSIPGVAMKSTGAGAIIGMALTEYSSEETGSVIIFVGNGKLEQPTPTSDTENQTSSEVSPNILSSINNAISELFKNIVEFFNKVIFHNDVTFMGHATFNKDTAGHVKITAGETEITVTFDQEYENKPAVTATVELTTDSEVLELPNYAVYDLTTKGFKLKINAATSKDLDFSWIALGTAK